MAGLGRIFQPLRCEWIVAVGAGGTGRVLLHLHAMRRRQARGYSVPCPFRLEGSKWKETICMDAEFATPVCAGSGGDENPQTCEPGVVLHDLRRRMVANRRGCIEEKRTVKISCRDYRHGRLRRSHSLYPFVMLSHWTGQGVGGVVADTAVSIAAVHLRRVSRAVEICSVSTVDIVFVVVFVCRCCCLS